MIIPTYRVTFEHEGHTVTLRVPRDEVPPLIKLLVFNGITTFSSEEEDGPHGQFAGSSARS